MEDLSKLPLVQSDQCWLNLTVLMGYKASGISGQMLEINGRRLLKFKIRNYFTLYKSDPIFSDDLIIPLFYFLERHIFCSILCQ